MPILEREENSIRSSLLVMILRLLHMTPRGDLNGFDEYQMNEIKEFESLYLKYNAICAALPNKEPFVGVPRALVNKILKIVDLAWEQRVMRVVSAAKPDASCAVCLEGFEAEEEERGHAQALGCGHIYHKRCIVEWITENDSCPLCRFKVPE